MTSESKVMTSLHVSNLHEDVTDNMLLEKFSVAGPVSSVRVCRDHNTKMSLGHGYVNFHSHLDAKQALHTMHNDMLKGYPIHLAWDKKTCTVEQWKNANVFVRNLDKSITDKELRSLFSRFGEILSVKVASDENGSRGYGYVNFLSESAANNAIQKAQGMLIGRKNVNVQKYKSASERHSSAETTTTTLDPTTSKYSRRRNSSSPRISTSDKSSSMEFVEKSPSIHDQKLLYLQSLLCGKYKNFCNDMTNEIFDSNAAKGRFAVVSGKAVLVTTTELSHIKCCKLLEDLIYCHQMNLPQCGDLRMSAKDLQVAIKDEDHRNVRKKKYATQKVQETEKFKYLGIHIVGDQLYLVSFKQEDVEKAKDITDRFLEKLLHSKTFACKSHVARFIIKKYSSIFPYARLHEDGVKIVGDEGQVEAAYQSLRQKKFEAGHVSFSAPGLSTYFSQKEWQDFVRDFEKNYDCMFLACQDERPNLTTATPKLNVSVCQGNIVDETSDVIVNGVSSDFDLHWGTISPAVVRRAGVQLEEEFNSITPLLKGPLARATKGYKLPCKYVLHVVSPTSLNAVKDRIKLVLKHATRLGAKSVSFPTLGAGNIGLDPAEVAATMREAFEEFRRKQETQLQSSSTTDCIHSIRVVLFESSLMPGFRLCFETFAGKSDNANEAYDCDVENWNVEIVGSKEEDISKAKHRLLHHKSEILAEEEIIDDCIAKLGADEFCEMKELAKDIGSSFEVVPDSYSKILVSGLKHKVKHLTKEIRRVLEELVDAAIVAKVCIWKWEKMPGSFTPLPLRVSRKMVAQYEKSSVGLFDVKIEGKNAKVNLQSMTIKVGMLLKRIRREETSAYHEALPSDWDSMPGKTYGRYEVPSSSSEYKEVLQKFCASNPAHSSIVKIERIQNIPLYHQYQIKKKDVEKFVKKQEVAERELFHGTSGEDADKICADNFDRSFAGKNGTRYGKGTYFHVSSADSVSYASVSTSSIPLVSYFSSPTKHMFLALVLTGNYCQGNRDLKSPPPMGFGKPIRLYDSVVDNVTNPRMFVVFKDTSVYPKYLITFK